MDGRGDDVVDLEVPFPEGLSIKGRCRGTGPPRSAGLKSCARRESLTIIRMSRINATRLRAGMRLSLCAGAVRM